MSASEGMTLTADTQATPVFKDSRGRTFTPPTGMDDPRLLLAAYRLMPDGMVWRRLFPSRPDQARQARELVRCMLRGHDRAEDAEAVMSELVNAAVAHASGSPFFSSFIAEVQRFGTHGETLRVTVYHCGPTGIPTYRQRHSSISRRPIPGTADERCLLVIHALADAVGYWDAPPGTQTYPMSAEFTAPT
ncbi:ATP-binding protein [Sinosporangium album]|nr:ATP-binding protein [Sinosporangium album]